MAMTDVVLAVDGLVGRFGDSAGVSRPLIDCFFHHGHMDGYLYWCFGGSYWLCWLLVA